MRVDQELQTFLDENGHEFNSMAQLCRVDSITAYFTPVSQRLFKSLLLILHPGDGFTTAFQERMTDHLYDLAGTLAGNISVCTINELMGLVDQKLLLAQDMMMILNQQMPLQYSRVGANL